MLNRSSGVFSTLALLRTLLASLEGGARADSAGHGRAVASRRAPSVLEPSLGPAAGKTAHRFGSPSPHPTHGRGEPSLGRSAHPRRAAKDRNCRLGTHSVAVS